MNFRWVGVERYNRCNRRIGGRCNRRIDEADAIGGIDEIDAIDVIDEQEGIAGVGEMEEG